ncbi:MAG: nucleoside-diphosphate kinase [Acidobacteriota bacterium]|nr:nucleoside-diphosphate kinase [Acidobacteriota bacterium]
MSMQRTLAILKPDSVAAGDAGKILAHLEREGFTIVAIKKMRLTREQAEAFYEVHRERPFYGSLVDFMTSGPIIPLALEREDAVRRLREVMGATNPAEAAAGTLRKLYARSIEANAIHGSDSPENAREELRFFFSRAELIAS